MSALLAYCSEADLTGIVAGIRAGDPRVARVIGRVSAAIRHHCNRDFTVRANAAHTLPGVAGDYLPIPDMLANDLTVTQNGTPLTRDTDYRLIFNPDGTGVIAVRRLPWGTPWRGTVTLAGTDGYDTTVPVDIVQPAIRLAAREWTAGEGDYSEETGDSGIGRSRPPVGWDATTERDLAWYVRAPVIGVEESAL